MTEKRRRRATSSFGIRSGTQVNRRVRNVAEGFGRYNPIEFARFLDIARASILETQALLRKGLDVGYWPQDES